MGHHCSTRSMKSSSTTCLLPLRLCPGCGSSKANGLPLAKGFPEPCALNSISLMLPSRPELDTCGCAASSGGTPPSRSYEWTWGLSQSRSISGAGSCSGQVRNADWDRIRRDLSTAQQRSGAGPHTCCCRLGSGRCSAGKAGCSLYGSGASAVNGSCASSQLDLRPMYGRISA